MVLRYRGSSCTAACQPISGWVGGGDGIADAGEGATHGAEGNGGGGQTYKASIAGVWLVNSIGILVA